MPEDEQLIARLKGYEFSSTRTEDHPEFAKLRDRLETEGYIRTSRNSWNGDYALTDFSVNGAIFRKGDKFCCGAAIKRDIDYKVNHQRIKNL